MSAPTDSQLLWSQFTQQIVALMGGGGTEAGIQILPSAELLSGTKEGEINKSIDNFAQVIPQWGSMYGPSARTLITAYQLVLSQIKETATSSSSIEKEYEAENKKLATMMGKASDFKVGKIAAWVKASAVYKKAGISGPDFGKWFKNNGLQEYKSLLALQKAQTQKVANLLKAAGIASPVTGALDRLNDELSKINDDSAPNVIQTPGPRVLAGWATKPTDPMTFTMDNSSSTYDYSHTAWHSQSGGKLFGFISIDHHESGGSHTNILSTKTTYNLKVEFDATASVVLQQGSWFDDAVLGQYKNGPWVAGSSFAGTHAHPYGQGGVLPLIATKLFVVRNPTLTLSMDKKDFNSVYDQLNSNFGSGVNLGCFAFGGSQGSKTSIHQAQGTTAGTQGVTVKDTSGIPQIVAVVNQIMP